MEGEKGLLGPKYFHLLRSFNYLNTFGRFVVMIAYPGGGSRYDKGCFAS